MNSKKGFTLIELLAAIVILGIVLALAAVSITNAISNAKLKSYVYNEEQVIKAAQSYMLVNTASVPATIGETTEIKLSDLKTSKFLRKVKSPEDSSVECDGYVLATKIAAKKYKYIPHVDCKNGIGSSTADGLVSHYTFDDFQEPTTNIITNGDFTNGLTGWSCAGAAANFNNYCKILYDQTGKPYLRVHWERTSGTGNSWPSLRSSVHYNTAGVPYSLSCKIKINGQSGETAAVRHAAVDNDYWTTGAQYWGFGGRTINKWNDVSLVRTFASTYTNSGGTVFPLNAVFELYSGNLETAGEYVDFDITDIQIEQKPYATAFVNGTRTGMVTDSSLNSNNITMTQASTPKWEYDNTLKSGAYKFDGASSYLSIPRVNYPEMSISLWFKRDTKDTVNADSIFGGWQWNSNVQLQQGFDLRFYINSDNLEFTLITQDSGGTKTTKTTGYTLSNYLGKWVNAVITYKKTTGVQSLYVDGKLVSTTTHAAGNTITPLTDYADMRIGFSRINNGYFGGSIDDVKIYSRVLSENEIKLNYDLATLK